jgi:hypothetical protein
MMRALSFCLSLCFDMNSSEVLFCALILIKSAEIAPNGRAAPRKTWRAPSVASP